MKVVYSELRGQGHDSSAYLDDSALFGGDKCSCQRNVNVIMQLLDSLGFTVHPDKSDITPSQCLEFLGFILNSVEMSVTLTQERKDKIKKACMNLLQIKNPNIRQLAEVIGMCVEVEPGCEAAPLHYK